MAKKKNKLFLVPVWTEEILHYSIPAKSKKEAEEIVQDGIDSGVGLTPYSYECQQCDCGVIDSGIEEIK